MNESSRVVSETDFIDWTPADRKQHYDELLDLYSLYLKTKIPTVKEEVIRKAYLLHLYDPSFFFVI